MASPATKWEKGTIIPHQRSDSITGCCGLGSGPISPARTSRHGLSITKGSSGLHLNRYLAEDWKLGYKIIWIGLRQSYSRLFWNFQFSDQNSMYQLSHRNIKVVSTIKNVGLKTKFFLREWKMWSP